jgi:hypothetical protein
MQRSSTFKHVKRYVTTVLNQLNGDITHKYKEGEEIQQTLYNKGHDAI